VGWRGTVDAIAQVKSVRLQKECSFCFSFILDGVLVSQFHSKSHLIWLMAHARWGDCINSIEGNSAASDSRRTGVIPLRRDGHDYENGST
jgi:hypothetical protein